MTPGPASDGLWFEYLVCEGSVSAPCSGRRPAPAVHNPTVSEDRLRAEEIESRWEAAPAVALVIAGQLVLALVSRAEDWMLAGLPWWVWLLSIGPEIALLIPLAWNRPRRHLEQLGHRRTVALALLGVISLTNALLLIALIVSLVNGDEKSGGQLLLKAITVWGTNVITFGLLGTGASTAEARSADSNPTRPRPTFSSRSWKTRNSHDPTGGRAWSTTSTSRSPTRSRSAPPTRCRSRAGPSC